MIGGGAQKITVEIGGKIAASLTRSIKAAQVQVSSFGRNVTRTMNDAATAGKKSFRGILSNDLWQSAAVGAAGIGVALVSSTRVAMNFEKSMSSVAAKLQASAEETTKLGTLAKDLGATTKFTASQAADAMDFLAMAGFKTNQIIDATPGILNLAAMSNMDLAEAADITSNILGGMGLEVAKTGRLVDVLAKASVNGNVNVRMMGESFKYAGPVMKQAGVSIEQAAAMMAVLGDSGIQAGEAGTGLRGVILRLAAPPTEAAAALKKLGIATADAQGNLKPMPALLTEIGTAMNKVQGTANRAQLAEALFGKLQIASGNVLLESARLGQLDERIRTVTDSGGAATQMAAKMQDNLSGALTRLGSAVEGFQLALAGPNSKPMQGFVDGLASLVGGATKFLNTFPGVGAVVVGLSAAFVGLVAIAPFVAAFISVVGTLATAIGAVTASFPVLAGIGTVLAVAAGPITAIIAGIVGIGLAIKAVVDYWPEISTAATRASWQVKAQWGKFTRWFVSIPGMIISIFEQGNIGQRIITSIIDGLKAKFSALVGWVKGAWSNISGIFNGSATPTPAAPAAAPAAGTGGIYGTAAPPGRASGGPVRAGQPYVVGERRRELFVPGMDGAIIPRIARPVTAGAGVTINAPVTIHAAGGDAMAIRDQVRMAFEDLIARAYGDYRVALND